MLGWLDAVEVEYMTRCGDTRTALRLIAHAEDVLAEGDADEPCPVWMDWFTPVRLAAFKGNTQLTAGRSPHAPHPAFGGIAGPPDGVSGGPGRRTADRNGAPGGDACDGLMPSSLRSLHFTPYEEGIGILRTSTSDEPVLPRS
jgi:hypothetical protein